MDGLPSYVNSWIIRRTQETRYQCSICTKGFMTHHGDIVGIRCHLTSRQHIEKIMEQEALFCKICQVKCKHPSQYKIHIETKGHKQKENPQLKSELKCEVCDVKFRSYVEEARHRITKKHSNMVAFESFFLDPASEPEHQMQG